MTKRELIEVDLAKNYCSLGYPDIAARSLGTIIRSTRSSVTADQVKLVADLLNLSNHPDFII